MHRKHLEIILLAAATDPVARKHHMSADDLHKCLGELRPQMTATDLRAVSALAVTAPPHAAA